jgi:hypothetical protein
MTEDSAAAFARIEAWAMSATTQSPGTSSNASAGAIMPSSSVRSGRTRASTRTPTKNTEKMPSERFRGRGTRDRAIGLARLDAEEKKPLDMIEHVGDYGLEFRVMRRYFQR